MKIIKKIFKTNLLIFFALFLFMIGLNKVFAEWTGKMEPTNGVINIGETIKVSATQTGEIRVNTMPTYVSSDESIATVDRNGNVTGVKEGTVTITGKYGNLVAGTTTIIVNKASTKWTAIMEPTSVTIEVNEITQVSAIQTSDIIVETIATYVSSDESVAIVDRNGKVTGIKEGTAIITGKYGNLVAGTTTVVVKKPSTKWTAIMEPTSATIKVGETIKVSAIQTSDIKVKTMATYVSSDESIAVVDKNGVVTGIKEGTVTITGKYGNLIAGTTTITVNKVSMQWTGVMEPSNVAINIGETTQVYAKQTGDLRVNTMPTYVSSDESVAVVDKNGVVTGIKEGIVTITGKYGNLVAGTTKVTVKKLSMQWTAIMEPTSATIKVGKTIQVSAKQTGDVKVKTIATFTSSDESVAKVDNHGVVTGIKEGTAIITGKFGDLVAGTTIINVVNINNTWTGDVEPKSLTILVGDTGKVTAKQTSELQVNTMPTYISSNEKIATVDKNGIVTGIKEGTVTITGKYGNLVAGKVTVTVKAVETANSWQANLKASNSNIKVGETTNVIVEQPADMTFDSIITYTSSDENIAKVDTDGNIIAINPGVVTISAKVGNNLYVEGTKITIDESKDDEKMEEGKIDSSRSNSTNNIILSITLFVLVLVGLFAFKKIK